MTNNRKYPAELCEWAVRLVLNNERLYGSRWKTNCSAAEDLGQSIAACRYSAVKKRQSLARVVRVTKRRAN